MTRWVASVLLVLGIAGLALGTTPYSITVQDGINTPDKSVELEGSTFTVHGIAVVSAGDTITATVTVPDDNDGYRVYIYGTTDGSRQIIDSKYRTAETSVPFDTSGFEPGTYTFALHTDGDYQAVYPFIVSGATIDLTSPDAATVGDEITVEAEVATTTADVEITGVEVVIYGDGTSKRVSTTPTESGYTATIDTSDLPAGDYTVYAVVQNNSNTPTGNPEPIGLSTQQTLTIEQQSTTTGGQQTTTTTTSTTTTTPANSTTSATTKTTQTTRPPTTTTTRTTITTEPTTNTQTASRTSTTTDNVIEPNTTTTQTTSTSAPGFSIGASIGAVLLAIGLRRRYN